MDLQDSKSITDCVSDVVAHFGKIDILVNAAGIPGGGDPATLTDEYWLNVINTDLNGQFFTCREVVRQSMKPNQYGRIIMVSSIHFSAADCSTSPLWTAGQPPRPYPQRNGCWGT